MPTADYGLSGLTTLLNPELVNKDINLQKEEQRILNGDETITIVSNNDKDLDEILKLSKELNINLDGLPKTNPLDALSDTKASSVAASHKSTVIPTPTPVSNMKMVEESLSAPPIQKKSMEFITEEHKKKNTVNSVLETMRGGTGGQNVYSTQAEQAKDLRDGKLEQIYELRDALAEEGVDVSAIPIPSVSSPVEEIDSILHLLTRKNNRYKYSSMAEEFLSGGAELIETFFDGTRTIPVLNIAPDYTGYSNNVNAKLHRLRFETSQIVGNAIERHNVSPLSRVLMELVPGFVLYPRIRYKQTTSKPATKLSSSSSSNAFNNIRARTEVDSFDMLKNL
jgi:hypothetical protein